MRKIVALFLFCILSPLYAQWNLGSDLVALDFIWQDSMRFDIESGYRMDDIRFSFASSYGKSKVDELNVLEGGFNLSFYPFKTYGFFIGCTLLKVGYIFGLGAPDNPYYISSDASVGWTVEFPYCYIEPRLSFSDSLLSENSTLLSLRESISQYSPFRLSLFVGVWI